MKKTVHFGFIAVICIMTLLSFAWLWQIKISGEKVLTLIELSEQKAGHAHAMRNAVHEQQLLLLNMLVINNPIETDEKIAAFLSQAQAYREARNALHDLAMSPEEKELYELLDQQLLITQPENNRAAEMLQQRRPKDEIVKVITRSRNHQAGLLRTLDRFIELQKTNAENIKKISGEIVNKLIYWISLSGFAAIIISILISLYVSKRVAARNIELVQAGKDMEEACKKAEQATQLRSEFLATMGHEIRTPLTAIIGFAGTILFSEQTMEQRQKAIHTIIRSGKHLLQVINDILDLSKVEANKLELENVELSLFDLLTDVERLVRPAAEEKGLKFSIEFIYPLPEKIISDPLRLKQILINLCNNAIKFTERGFVLLKVSCGSKESHHVLSIEVVDSGIGMTAEEIERVFQAYRQADSSVTRKYGGAGLGLTLSALLAERLNGSISVSSEIDNGSKFKFTLNVASPSEATIVYDRNNLPDLHHASEHIIPSKHLSGHVLVVEDNVDNQQLIKIYLNRMGIEVTIADNGELAVKAAAEDEFDLVLMDIRMPVMGGIEASKMLRARGFTRPIIALTANATKEDKEACFAAGCNEFLTKPVDAIKLAETFKKYLESKKEEKLSKPRIISSLLDYDAEMIDLVEQYVAKLEPVMNEIETLINAEDWSTLSGILHQLKGSGGNFGYRDLSSLAGQMEFQVKIKNKNELMYLLANLKSCYQQIISGLEKTD